MKRSSEEEELPAGHAASLGDGVTPQVEAHGDDGAGQEDGENGQGANDQVQEGVEDGAAEGTCRMM